VDTKKYNLNIIAQRPIYMILVLFLLLSINQNSLLAQDEGSATELALKISEAQANNLISLKNYSWKMSSNIEVEGELKLVVLTQFRFNTNGELEKTQISNEWKVEKKKFVAGKKQQSAMEESQKVSEEAFNLLKQYLFMSKGQLVDFYEKANVSKSSEEGTIVIEANSVVVKDDNVVQTVDEETLLTHSMNIKSILSTNNMTSTVKLESLEDGTNRPVQLIVEIPTKNLKIVMENFDFILQK
jgi:hypothetical protein